MSRAPSPSTLSRAAEKLRSYGELKLADALAPRKSLKEPKSTRLTKLRRDERRAERNEITAAVRADVWMRSEGRCEACRIELGHAAALGSMDHFFGGSKRRAETTVPGCWRLCSVCDRAKTENSPDRLWWLRTYLLHCQHWKYDEQVRKVRSAILLEEAQHPSRTPEPA